jgi:hypothetical protein
MYWFREVNGWALLLSAWVIFSWSLGGWLMASHVFDLERRERFVGGFALGLVCYVWFANFVGHWLPSTWAFVAAGMGVLCLGVVSAWRHPRPWLAWQEIQIAWPGLLAGFALIVFFTFVGRGLAIFDEPKNLSLISRMAAGDIPPHFYMQVDYYFRYHYGFQLFAATLMRLAGLFAWSAFDLSKALVFALAVLLAGLVGMRMRPARWAGIMTGVTIALAGGTRYLLLLLPAGALKQLDAWIVLQGTSSEIHLPFSQALWAGWTQDGGPPVPFPFAFVNGIFPPLTMAHAGSYALSCTIICLLILLMTRLRSYQAVVPLSIVLAAWALTWESSYGLFGLGAAIFALVGAFRAGRQGWRQALLRPEMVACALSALFVLLQGGTITEIARKVLLAAPDAGIGSEGMVAATGFSLRWPPALFSAHLGPLTFSNPLLVLVALCEAGLVVLFSPWITAWAWQRAKQGEWVLGALIASTWVGLLIPLFLVYQAERDISRFTGYTLFVWVLFLTLALLEKAPQLSRPTALRWAGGAALGLMVITGLVLTGYEWTAISQPVLGYKLDGMDARVAQATWNRLGTTPKSSDTLVFDVNYWRATALTGLPTRAAVGNQALPTWDALVKAPTVPEFLRQGYRYVYLDEVWWEALLPDYKASLSSPCVQVIAEYWNADHDQFRRLLDLQGCAP